MTPEAADYLVKARDLLGEARAMLEVVHLNGQAARTAYLAGFHAAQALIFERTGKIAKTHRGVRKTLARLIDDTPPLDRSFTQFLGRAYRRKEIADYGIGSSTVVTESDASEVIEDAERFVTKIAAILA